MNKINQFLIFSAFVICFTGIGITIHNQRVLAGEMKENAGNFEKFQESKKIQKDLNNKILNFLISKKEENKILKKNYSEILKKIEVLNEKKFGKRFIKTEDNINFYLKDLFGNGTFVFTENNIKFLLIGAEGKNPKVPKEIQLDVDEYGEQTKNNCFSTSLFNIVKFHGLLKEYGISKPDDFRLLGEKGIVDSSLFGDDEDINSIHKSLGLIWYQMNFEDLPQIKNFIANGNPLLLVDNYKKHTVTITGYNDKGFYIIDSLYTNNKFISFYDIKKRSQYYNFLAVLIKD